MKEYTIHYVDRLRGDIGVFGEHSESLGREILLNNLKTDQIEVRELIRKLNGNQEAHF